MNKIYKNAIEYEFIKYSLNDEDKTAIIVGYKNIDNNNIFIPRSIVHNSQEYIITRISSKSFFNANIKTMQFAEDLELQTIESGAFLNSKIHSISIPSSCIELKEGWCAYTENFTNVKVNENNPRYSVYDDKFIVGKTSDEKENFDVLVFCSCDIQTATIPNFIEIIGPFCFNSCKKLQTINFQNDSKFFLNRFMCFFIFIN